MKRLIYKLLQKLKEGSVFYPGTRVLEKRKYLTIDGIKDWNELTLKDKLMLNIKI